MVGIEATGSMQWFLELLEELGIKYRVGHPARIRAAETRKQKHDRRDARLILDLLVMEDRFPEIWMRSMEQRDLLTLLRDRHQWVKMRARLQHTMQSMALNHGLRQGPGLWSVHSTFSKNRHGRFQQSKLFEQLFEQIVRQCVEVGLVRGKELSVDGSFIEANAAKESRIPREQLVEAAEVHQTLRQYLQ